MKKYHVVFDFLGLTIPEKVERGRNILTMLVNNPHFPTPDVALADLKAKTDLLENHSILAINGGKSETAVMRKTEKEWDDLMRIEARYVDRIADGDQAFILGAGFNLTKQPSPVHRPEFSAVLGDSPGTILLRRHAVQGAKSYIWQYSFNSLPEKEEEWKTREVTSKASVVVNDLTPLAKHWFRVAVVTPEGTSAYSAPIMQMVM